MNIIEPFYSKNLVPICFSANDRYAPLLAVTIKSIVNCSNPDKNYDIVVLTSSMSSENQEKILSVKGERKNISIRFFDVNPLVYGFDFYTESDPTNSKYSSEIYFRFLEPALMQLYKKVIYLDADLVVLDDVSKLLDIDLSGKLLAAVRDYEGIANCYSSNYERTKYRISELGITDFENYFISGVLVLNNEEFNKYFSMKQLLDLAVSKNWKQYDQDVLNYVANKKSVIIDAAWDFVEDIYGNYNHLPEHLFEEYEKSEKNPKIVHYSANRKPWINTSSRFNNVFWETAKQTPYYDFLSKFLTTENFNKF